MKSNPARSKSNPPAKAAGRADGNENRAPEANRMPDRPLRVDSPTAPTQQGGCTSADASDLGPEMRSDEKLEGKQSDEALIDQAEQQLRQLEARLAAARAEMDLAELQNALAAAREGDMGLLRDWEYQEAMADSDRAYRSLSKSPHGSQLTNKQPPSGGNESEATIQGWEQLLPFAVQRNASRLGNNASPSSRNTLRTAQAKGLDREPVTASMRAEPDAGLLELAKQLKQGRQEDQRTKRLFIPRMRGAVTSLVAHVGLLFLLAFITLRMPAEPAGLSIASSNIEPVEADLQVTQPTEVSSPTERELPLEMEPSVDALSDMNSSVVDIPPLTVDGVAATDSFSQAMAATSGALAGAMSEATFFGAAAGGNCFCYVIDGSGSMRGGPWEAAKFELLKSLASLNEKQRFYIIFFNRKLSAIPLPGEKTAAPRAIYATKENLNHARRWLETLEIGVGAPPNKALEMAISREPDAIYLLTDGVTRVDVPKFLREENRVQDLINGEQIRVPIHSIAFYSLEGQALLRQVAKENGGQFIYVPDPSK